MLSVALKNNRTIPRGAHRLAIGAFFFIQGLCFASWASRIPSIQQELGMSEAALGSVLLALPAGLMLSLPISGWLVAKVGSQRVVIIAAILYTLSLLSLGLVESIFQLVVCLFVFGLIGNVMNISVNTQAVGVEALYKKSIMASFHGLWSLAGFTGAAVGTFMIGSDIGLFQHYIYISLFVLITALLSFRFTLGEDANKKKDAPLFAKPDKALLILGIIAFCSMLCEGAMFDWSGVYFRKVVQADPAWVGAGFTAFMSTMAAGRFIADWFTSRYGLKLVLQLSGVLISIGLGVAIALPALHTAIIGFLLVGVGVSSVVPLVYSAAGKSKVLSPGVALAAVSTIGFLGFLIGPPLIGIVAGFSNLQVSFSIIALMGLLIVALAGKVVPSKS
ncbi:MFS transporter [Cesiribacter sp. SM1]|uniref:MFS transporter n=1 Tax=Cesiribacter sp. SM1 TaxID=2861196 RepID=UPI001CD3C501|nr:MFS transporter [Cesiribacter sp. SM1]